jgi:hypothetical protein
MERRDDGKEHLTWGDRTRAGNIPKTFDDELAGGRAPLGAGTCGGVDEEEAEAL